jgi:hypothetical protein
MKVDPARPGIPSVQARGSINGLGFEPISPSSAGASAIQTAKRVASLAGVDAVLALQGIETTTDKRRRQRRRGTQMLDAMERLQAELLGGQIDSATVTALRDLARDREASGEPGLDQVLREIEVRAAVELAKLAKSSRE